MRGWKQATLAASMKITQQAYSCLEQGANNARLETLKRYCDIMKVELPFLIAIDVPITEETLEKFGSKSYNEILTTYKNLEQKLAIYEELLAGKLGETPLKENPNNQVASIKRI